MSYTCFPRLELQAVAHLHIFSKLELYTIDELAHELSGVKSPTAGIKEVRRLQQQQTCLHIIATRSRSSDAVLCRLTQKFTPQRAIDQAFATIITLARRAAERGANGTRNALAGGGIIWESAAKNSTSLAGVLQNPIIALIYRN